jgi:hypothetical protein
MEDHQYKERSVGSEGYLPRGHTVHLYFLRGSPLASSTTEAGLEIWDGEMVDCATTSEL